MNTRNNDSQVSDEDEWADDLGAPATDAQLMGLEEGGDHDSILDGKGASGEGAHGGGGEDDLDLSLLSAIAEDDEPAHRRDPVIPRGRFDEVNTARRAAEARAAELEAEVARLAAERATPQQGQGQPADGASAGGDTKGAESFDFEAKERAYLEAQWEGDVDAALSIRREINAELRRQAADEAMQRSAALESEKESAKAAKEAAAAVERVAVDILSRIPALSENDGDNPAMREFSEWRDFYIASRGMSQEEAMIEAAARISPDTMARDPRKDKAMARGADVSTRQPPPLSESGAGNRTAPPFPNIESQDDWDRLPEKERERLLAGG